MTKIHHLICMKLFLALPIFAIAQSVPEHLSEYTTQELQGLERKVNLDGSLSIPLPSEVNPIDSPVAKIIPLPSTDNVELLSSYWSDLDTSRDSISELNGENVLVMSGKIFEPQKNSSDGENSNKAMFTFYNYDTQRAVEVFFSKDNKIITKEREKGFQPPVSAQEVETAKNLWLQKVGIPNYPSNILEPRALAQTNESGERVIFFQNFPINNQNLENLPFQSIPIPSNEIYKNSNTLKLEVPTNKESAISALTQKSVIDLKASMINLEMEGT